MLGSMLGYPGLRKLPVCSRIGFISLVSSLIRLLLKRGVCTNENHNQDSELSTLKPSLTSYHPENKHETTRNALEMLLSSGPCSIEEMGAGCMSAAALSTSTQL